MSILYIVGDSFSSAEKLGRDQEKTWWYRLAQKLQCKGFTNWSMIGSAQEYAWYMLLVQMNQITPDDYLLIVSTHPSRRWWVIDDPTLGKVEFLQDADHIDDNIAKTAELWERYVQTPQMDSIAALQRLGWLSSVVQNKKLRKPLVIFGFDQLVPGYEEFTNIKYSKGSLTENVATPEVPGGHADDVYNKLIQGIDPRYNHMCLRNHEVMLEKTYNAFTTDQELDLTTGFELGILTNESINDPTFIEKELDLLKTQQRGSQIKKKNLMSMFQLNRVG
jgi:hypothetical protein